ncbi:hypothetical protein IV203_023929 [Nitzschia inconspicua]|uniref:Sulfotransferase domain-containing protein n=1 Tax=Nitzschia inconspicua TaxID=303405 RepID=A0A9K3KBM1_9STRA|nr:hypothetical protein IV203_023929 [Nitzschia inconspicua]
MLHPKFWVEWGLRLLFSKRSLAIIFGSTLLLTVSWQIDVVFQQQQPAGTLRRSASNNFMRVYLKPSPSPTQQPLPNYQRWNHVNHTFESAHRRDTNRVPSSFEILETVLRDFRQQPQPQEGSDHFHDDACLKPNMKHTKRLVQRVKRQRKKEQIQSATSHITLPFPVLNMGFPKSGSSSLMRWFKNAGYNVTHFVEDGQYVGLQILQNVLDGYSPFANDLAPYHVHAQMDYTGGDDPRQQATTIFPQIQLLDEIHHAQPNATFVLMFRPVQEWIESTQSWNRYPFRWAESNIPGLMLTEQQRYERDTLHERIVVTPQQLQDWWCSHVLHIRQFVKEYPSHALIELDLYDSESSAILSELFAVDGGVVSWNKANSNSKKHNVNKSTIPQTSSLQETSTELHHEKWNFTSNAMTIDEGGESSLKLLEQVIHDGTIMKDESCFRAIPRHDSQISIPLASPILNVGLPMDPWNDMLKEFFSCLGLKVTHRKGQGGKFGSTGKKINQAVQAGMPPLSGYFGNRDVYTQLDYTATLNSTQGIFVEQSVFPQIQLLDEIHQEVPNATLLLPYPNFDQWMDFAQSFHNFTERWARMEMPGLVLTEEQYQARSLPCPTEIDEDGMVVNRCIRLSDMQLREWWCGHIHHVRRLVKDVYPSHTLLEIDFGNLAHTREAMKELFPQANQTCLSELSFKE